MIFLFLFFLFYAELRCILFFLFLNGNWNLESYFSFLYEIHGILHYRSVMYLFKKWLTPGSMALFFKKQTQERPLRNMYMYNCVSIATGKIHYPSKHHPQTHHLYMAWLLLLGNKFSWPSLLGKEAVAVSLCSDLNAVMVSQCAMTLMQLEGPRVQQPMCHPSVQTQFSTTSMSSNKCSENCLYCHCVNVQWL